MSNDILENLEWLMLNRKTKAKLLPMYHGRKQEATWVTHISLLLVCSTMPDNLERPGGVILLNIGLPFPCK